MVTKQNLIGNSLEDTKYLFASVFLLLQVSVPSSFASYSLPSNSSDAALDEVGAVNEFCLVQ